MIGIACDPKHYSVSSRLRTVCGTLALAASCAASLVQTVGAQATAPPSQAKSANAPRTDRPEESVDTSHKEAGLVPIAPASPIAVVSYQKLGTGVAFKMRPGVMTVLFCTDSIVHVLYSPGDDLPADKSLAVIGSWGVSQIPFKVLETPQDIRLLSDKLSVRVDRTTGAVTFLTLTGEVILAETPNGGKAMQRVKVNGVETYRLEQGFISPADEGLYGMAEGQDGVWNWRGMPIDLKNANIIGALPMMVSSRGYGLLWDNESATEFNPMSPDQQIPLDSASHTGSFTARATGDYVFFVRGGDGAGDIGITVAGRVTHDDKNMWVPDTSVVKVRLSAGKTYAVKVLGGGKAPKLYGGPLGNTTVFSSEVGKDISYYFIYGPDIQKVVAGYRQATGTAPLFPKWAYGFWQSREHYSSQNQILDAAAEFRKRQIPVDLLIQDWQYWGKWGWGSYQFDPTAYPDPAQMVKTLHQMNFHFMVSVWPNPKGEVQDDLAHHHGLIDDTGYIDEFSAQARSIRWKYLKKYMFDIGVDAWWQDGEDAYGEVRDHKIYVEPQGYVSGNPYTNAYPQAANQCIYQGQREATSTKRVVQLGKTCTLGMQRYASATWSGDVHGNWQTLSRQIPAGLNVSIGGIPYWTTDTGGFFRPKDEYSSPSYNQLLTRWFEYSTFCPILRIHGYQTATEMWKWPLSYKNLLMYDNFRYRMLPYIYSEAWQITDRDDTLMRGLVMDFQSDPNVYNISDQYMFGSAFMVSPVTTPLNSRQVYLPKGTSWTNFWTGRSTTGGRDINVEAPLQQIPLFVRAGAILPLGPTMQYATQKPEDPIELRLYPGSNGSFTLYEDESDNYDYEKGLYATIQFTWNDTLHALTIGQRQGSFPGMRKERTFRIVVVRPQHGTGFDQTVKPDQVVAYTGNPVTVHVAAREN